MFIVTCVDGWMLDVGCVEENKQFSDLYALFFSFAWGHQTAHAKIALFGNWKTIMLCYDDDGGYMYAYYYYVYCVCNRYIVIVSM